MKKVKKNTQIKRFLSGLLGLLLLFSIVYIFLPGWIETYGATGEEVNDVYFGDEILPEPLIMWTHAISIAAPPEDVWPWVVQIGQSRGGYYSYTFIENLIAQDGSYKNASCVLPKFQHPQTGDMIITDLLPLYDIKPDDHFFAATEDFFGIGWTWGWYLKPAENDSTRLIIRMKIQSDGDGLPSAAVWFMNAGGFVMENAMLRGIKDRAEGRALNTPVEWLEIALWMLTLIFGFIAAWFYTTRPDWQLPLIIGFASVLSLLVFTFVQPAVILRVVIVLLLASALWQTEKKGRVSIKKE